MLLWSPRSRAIVLAVFAAVVLVVFALPLGTVVLAGLAGSWTGPLPSDLGFARFTDDFFNNDQTIKDLRHFNFKQFS